MTLLQHFTKLSDYDYRQLTPEQIKSASRVLERQGLESFVRASVSGDKVLCITFKHIFIGIETDGYAHS